MIDTAKALYQFWSSFDLPAYVENDVPDWAKLPYITYEVAKPDGLEQIPYFARVWYRSSSYVEIATNADEIEARIKGGCSIPFEDGCMVLYKESAFIQFQSFEDDDDVKVAYLSMLLNVYKN